MKKKHIKPIDEFTETAEERELAESANFRKSELGLPVNIYVGDKDGVPPYPTIKAQADYNYDFDKLNVLIITIEKNPAVKGDTRKLKQRDIEKVKDLVKINFEVLLKYWNLEIDIFELVSGLKK